MIKLYKWLLSHPRWIVLALGGIPTLALLIWILSHRTAALIACILIWLGHMALGIVAAVAGMRLWPSRHVPLLGKLWLYINAFLIDVVSGIVLLFVARGVRFTWTFTAVMFTSTLLSDIVRSPLLLSLVRGQSAAPETSTRVETSGQLPPQFWLDAFRQIVKEEVQVLREEVTARLQSIEQPLSRK